MARHSGGYGNRALRWLSSNNSSRESDYSGAETDGAAGDRYATVRIFGLPLSCASSLVDAVQLVRDPIIRQSPTPFLVTFANPLAVRLSNSDPSYRFALRRMDLIFCDGIAMAWAARRLARCPMERISFDSTGIAPAVFGLAEQFGRTVALVGGRPGIAEAAARQIRQRFPRLDIAAAVDGYRNVDDLVEVIRPLDPDIVVCGMGAPRQEIFLAALGSAGWRGVGFTCGGYLDQLVGAFDFYPAFINRLNLRWLYRLIREPRRIGYRCTVEYGPFWKAIATELVRQALVPRRHGGQS